MLQAVHTALETEQSADTVSSNTTRWKSVALCSFLLICAYQRFDFKASMDLMPTYLASEFANLGEWQHVYHPTVYIRGTDPVWSQRLRQLGERDHGTSFTSHPYYLTVVRPLVAVLEADTFRKLFTVFSMASVVLLGAQLARLIGSSSVRSQVLFTLLVAFAAPTTIALHLGQNTILALAASLAALLAWSSRRSGWQGSVWAFAAILCKPWCILLIAPLALLRGFRFAAAFGAVTAVLMVLVPYGLFPSQLMSDYNAMNAELGRLSLVAPNNHSILSTLDRLSWRDWVPAYMAGGLRYPSLSLRLLALAMAGAVVTAVGVPFLRLRRETRWIIACSLAVMIVPLGVSWNHYFSFALPLALLLTFEPDARPVLRCLGVLLLGMCLSLEALLPPFIQLTRDNVLSPPSLALLTGMPMAFVSVVAICAAWLSPRAMSGPSSVGSLAPVAEP